MFKYKLGNRDWTYIELPDLGVAGNDEVGSLALNKQCTNGASREALAGVPLGRQAHYEGEFISSRLEYPKWGVRIILQPPPPSDDDDDDQEEEQAESSDSVAETEGTEASSYTLSSGPSDEREEDDEGSNRVLEPGSDEQEDQDTGRQHDEGQDQEEEEDDDEEAMRKLKKLRIMEPGGPSAVEHEEEPADGGPQLSEGREEQDDDEAEVDASGPESGNEQEEDLVAHFKAHTSVIVAGRRNLTRRHYGIFSKSQGVEIRHSEGEGTPAGLEWTLDTSSYITVATIRAIYTY